MPSSRRSPGSATTRWAWPASPVSQDGERRPASRGGACAGEGMYRPGRAGTKNLTRGRVMALMWRRWSVLVWILAVASVMYGAPLARAAVRRVGAWNGAPGQYKTIQAAVNAAHPGDWILVGPGDYKEQGNKGAAEPAGVLITTPNLHLRGMNRNAVVVDGTKPGASQCSSRPADQGTLNRNGVEVFKADNTWIENLSVCNFLDGTSQGEQVWWNGGDGSGHIGPNGFWGNYLTATSSYSSTVPAAAGPCR